MVSTVTATALTAAGAPSPQTRERRPVVVDFLFLDLDTCTRCVGTDRNLEEAVASVRRVLAETGVRFEVRRHLVDSEEMARRLQFVSSPTLRVNGKDIALELRESSCGSEPCTDGCGAGIDCRIWTHDGEEFTQAPTGLIVDALLQEIYSPQPAPTVLPEYVLPENLRRFFAGDAEAVDTDPGACCPAPEQLVCCEPSEKVGCCGGSTGEGCGCR
jgi:hypothetical protein